MKISSKVRNASIRRMNTVARMAGFSIGKVMCQKIWKRLAPSICACSKGSLGRDDRAASRVSVTSGVQCQISMITTAVKAWSEKRLMLRS